MNSNDLLYAGIDGGGTHCRVKLASATGEILGCGVGGTANPSHGLATVVQSIMTAVNIALTDAGLSKNHMARLVVGAGLAGLHLPRYLQMMQNWQHPFNAIYYTDDLHTALMGAHNGGDGAVVIVGTGFSALSLVNGKKTAIGGYGFLQADHCSGSWLGYQAVQAALLAHDKLTPPTLLSDLLYDQLPARAYMLADKLADAGAREYGALAPLVFQAAEQGDACAQQLLNQSCDFIERTLQLLSINNPPRVSLVGGVAERLIPRLAPSIQQQLSPPLKSAEDGAISFARQQRQSVTI